MSDAPGTETTELVGTEAPSSLSLLPVRDELAVELDRARVWSKLFGAPAPTIDKRFTILARIGSGGMGDVYAAFDEKLDRKVAIKLVRATATVNIGANDEARLLREAKALARLSHPNVVQVYDVGGFRDRVFIAMEFIRGQTLRAWLAEQAEQHSGQRYQRAVLEQFIGAGRGLQAAHETGLVHRDFKPENVLIGVDDGRPRVVDFGLARALAPVVEPELGDNGDADVPSAGSGRPLASSVGHQAKQSQIVGTPSYMAPEHRRGQPVDGRADQFSFCVALYEALFRAEPAEARTAGAEQKLPRVRAREVAPVIREALLCGLSPDPDDRFADMNALLRELGAWPGRRRRRLLALVATALLLAGGTFFYCNARPDSDPCANTGQELADLWNPERQAVIARAFRDSGAPDGEAIWREASTSLQRYADEWHETRVFMCEATQKTHTLPARLWDSSTICLNHGRARFASLLSRLQEADPNVVARVSRVIATLPALSPCADDKLLLDGLSPPDGDEWQIVSDIRANLADALTLELFGEYQQALNVARRQLVAAKPLDYRAAFARALYYVGRFTIHGGTADDIAQGEAKMLKAKRIAEGQRALLLKADIWVSLMRSGVRRRDIDTVRKWSKDALVACEAIGDPPRVRAEMLRYLAVAERGDRQLQKAEELLRQGLAILDEDPETPVVVRARHLHDLGNVLRALGQVDDAQALYQRALESYRLTLGEHHQEVADLRFDMAMLDMERGHLKSARDTLVEVELVHRQTLGPDHSHVGRVLLALAELDRRDGALARGLERASEAMRIYRTVYPPDDPRIARAHTVLAALALRRGDYQDAVDGYQAALDIESLQSRANREGLALTRLNLAEALLRRERYDDALSAVAKAEPALKRYIEGGDAIFIGFVANLRGRALLGRGEIAAARIQLELAVRYLKTASGMEDEHADAAWALARALAPNGRGADDGARALARAALDHWQAQTAEVASPKDDVERWLRAAEQR